MKIEDSIKIPRNTICKKRNYLQTVHVYPKNGNKIISLYDKQGNLIEREILDESENGFEIYLGVNDELFWLCPVKEGCNIFEDKIAICRSNSI